MSAAPARGRPTAGAPAARRPGAAPHLLEGSRSNPFRHVTRALRAAIARLLRALDAKPGTRVLDFGCGEMQYADLLDPGVELVGADLPSNPLATLEISPEGTIPGAADGSFDAVISTQVLEHVDDPATYLAECHRVLRPGGRLLLSTHGIMLYHPDPVDLWRWTWAGLERIVTEAGFHVERREDVMGLVPTGLQLVQDGLYHRAGGRLRRRGVAFVMQGLIALAARLDRDGGPRHNALVFALLATRDDTGAREP